MKQQNNTQNLWLLWLDVLRDELAWMEVDPDVDADEVHERKELIFQVYPLVASGGKESS